MCGRYVSPDVRALEREWEIIHRSPGLDGRWEEGLYNAAPTRALPVVRMEDGKSFVQPMRWGFTPQWWKEDKLPTHTTNARIETVVTKPMWRSALRHSRALIPARGYYEWDQASQPKQPYFIRLPDEPLTCFAGLWSSWRDMVSFTILVGPAAAHLAHIHDRMPLTLPRSAWGPWLDPQQKDGSAALALAQAAALSHFQPQRVSTWVNISTHEGPRCIEPIAQDQETMP
jgi:putative SOS response-associated peptidase YedK